MKSQFLSTEALVLMVPAFKNETTGALIDGTDTCTFTYRKPDDSTGTVAGAYDATLKLWKTTIAAGSYMQGTWYVMAASNDATALPQWLVLTWGDWGETATVQATEANTNAQAAKTSADTAGTKADAAKISADAATAAAAVAAANAATAAANAGDAKTSADAATASADLAGASAATAATQSTTAATQATLARKLATNRQKVNTTTKQMVLYDDDGTTPLKTWDLKDETGGATATRIFERTPA